MAGIALSLLAAYAGPDRAVDVAVHEGRVYIAMGPGQVDNLVYDLIYPGAGAELIGQSGNWLHVTDPDSQIEWGSSWADISLAGVSLTELAGLGVVYQAVLGRYGYELSQVDAVSAGPYALVQDGDYGIGVWLGAGAPAGTGYAVLDVTDGAATPAGPAALTGCWALLSHDGLLWAVGPTSDIENRLFAFDGANWVDVGDGNGIVDLFDAGGALHGCGAAGCWKWTNWAWQFVGAGAGIRGASVNGRAWWAASTYANSANRIALLTDDAADIAGYGGRVWVIEGQALSWVDLINSRPAVQWTGVQLDNLAVHQNRLYAFGQAEGDPRCLEYGGAQARFIDAGRWTIQRLVSGVQPVAIGTLPGGTGQVVLQVAQGIWLDELGTEWADGSGESPRLDGVTSEWSSGPDNRPRLDGISTEWADGSGESPRLEALTTEWTDGTGESPEVEELGTEWATEGDEQGGGVELAGVSTEWADELVGPAEGESVVFVVEDFGGDVVGVRLVTDEPLSADWRAYMRLDRETAEIDAWGSYEALPVNANHVPTQQGSELRVAIIGPWADDRCPGIRVQVLTDAS